MAFERDVIEVEEIVDGNSSGNLESGFFCKTKN